jgi:predicted nucleic acid-binding protein
MWTGCNNWPTCCGTASRSSCTARPAPERRTWPASSPGTWPSQARSNSFSSTRRTRTRTFSKASGRCSARAGRAGPGRAFRGDPAGGVQPLVILLDTGPIVAAAARTDPYHERCGRLLAEAVRPLLVPSPVVAEVCHLLEREAGSKVEAQFLHSLVVGTLTVVEPTSEDYERMSGLVTQYEDLPLGGVDAAVVARRTARPRRGRDPRSSPLLRRPTPPRVRLHSAAVTGKGALGEELGLWPAPGRVDSIERRPRSRLGRGAAVPLRPGRRDSCGAAGSVVVSLYVAALDDDDHARCDLARAVGSRG